MLSINSHSNNPYFNIATEEYLLKQKKANCFLLYRNEPSIIVGIHQNTLSEINYDYVKQNGIKVVRRMTGGGTVFHDLGNLNFCFIMDDVEGSTHNFETYTRPILQVLNNLGVPAILQGRNDLTIDGRKFSGNAKLVSDGKVLQHGTILFTSRMGDLSSALNANPLKFADKAVKSIRSRVTNVSEHLREPITLDELIVLIRNHVHAIYPEATDYAFTPDEISAIQTLVDDKYSTWEWNYGGSPAYNYYRSVRTAAGTLEFYLQVEKGIICWIKIYGDFFTKKPVEELEELLTGTEHNEEALLSALQGVEISSWFHDVSKEEFVTALF